MVPEYGKNRPIILCYIATTSAGLLPSFDPECTSEHGIASIIVQHLSRSETGAHEVSAGCRYLVYASDASHKVPHSTGFFAGSVLLSGFCNSRDRHDAFSLD
jgi:hypothetical protein